MQAYLNLNLIFGIIPPQLILQSINLPPQHLQLITIAFIPHPILIVGLDPPSIDLT